MARRGQVGTVAVSGKWYVVRFWKYPPGRGRIHASERICPSDTKAPGYLPKGDRRRRANEIVAASGVNDAQQFIDAHNSVTFRKQAQWFLDHSMNRKRKPTKPSTLTTWRCCVDKWLNPNLGDLPLQSVNNATVKTLVLKMHEAGLSPQTIKNQIGLVKLIVASALNDDGDEIFPRKWNNEFLDMPLVENAHQPIFTERTVNQIVQKACGQDQVLFALLAGTGIRAGEALGLEIKHFSEDCRTITIEQSCWNGSIQTPKTRNAYRRVDVGPSLASFLKGFIEDRSGLVFINRAFKPLSQTNVLRRSLHPLLKELGVEETGFHAFRRFRTTWLRKNRAPEDLIRFWLGHAKTSITDVYSKLADDLEFRCEVSDKLGTGFDVPASMRPMRPRKSVAKEVNAAA
jgi:integrase